MYNERHSRWYAAWRTVAVPALFLFFFLALAWLRCRLPHWSLMPDAAVALLQQWQQRALAHIAGLGLGSEQTALLQAMLLGWRQQMPHAMRELYSQVGASHILALSGLHLGVLFCLLNALMRRVLGSAVWRTAVGVAMLAVMWLYVVLTGCSPSLVRASVMMSLLIAAQMRACGYSPWHALLMAAALILLFSPRALYSISFQLSFTAVAGIFLFYRPLSRQCRISAPPLRWLWNGICVSLGAQLGSLPLVAYYFHSISLTSVLLSPLYILLATGIMYSGIAAMLFGGRALVSVVALLMDVQHGAMRSAAASPFNLIGNLHPDALQVLFMYLAMLSLLPVLQALLPRPVDFPAARVERALRQWPFLLAAALFSLAGLNDF